MRLLRIFLTRRMTTIADIFSNDTLDIDEKYVATEITIADLTKVSRQLDHSMGFYI